MDVIGFFVIFLAAPACVLSAIVGLPGSNIVVDHEGNLLVMAIRWGTELRKRPMQTEQVISVYDPKWNMLKINEWLAVQTRCKDGLGTSLGSQDTKQ